MYGVVPPERGSLVIDLSTSAEPAKYRGLGASTQLRKRLELS